jgi:hypothetical protein
VAAAPPPVGAWMKDTGGAGAFVGREGGEQELVAAFAALASLPSGRLHASVLLPGWWLEQPGQWLQRLHLSMHGVEDTGGAGVLWGDGAVNRSLWKCYSDNWAVLRDPVMF